MRSDRQLCILPRNQRTTILLSPPFRRSNKPKACCSGPLITEEESTTLAFVTPPSARAPARQLLRWPSLQTGSQSLSETKIQSANKQGHLETQTFIWMISTMKSRQRLFWETSSLLLWPFPELPPLSAMSTSTVHPVILLPRRPEVPSWIFHNPSTSFMTTFPQNGFLLLSSLKTHLDFHSHSIEKSSDSGLSTRHQHGPRTE